MKKIILNKCLLLLSEINLWGKNKQYLESHNAGRSYGKNVKPIQMPSSVWSVGYFYY